MSDAIMTEYGLKTFENSLLSRMENLECVVEHDNEKFITEFEHSKELVFKTTNLITESIYNLKKELQSDLKTYEKTALATQRKNSALLDWFWLQTILQPIFFEELKSFSTLKQKQEENNEHNL